MTLKRRRIALWSALGLALLAGLAWAFRPQPVAVDLVSAHRGPLAVSVDEEGETRVRDVFVLSAPTAGRVQRIEIESGDAVVAAETVVAQIEPLDPDFLDVRSEGEARAAVSAAEAARALAAANLEKAQAELDFARSELERQRGLAARGAASERDLDIAERTHRTARAAVATARAALEESSFELDRARARLVSPLETQHQRHGQCQCIPLRAPVSGRVLRVLRESEGVVRAGEALLEIGDPDALEIVVDLLSADAVKVEPAMRVEIAEWGGETPLQGRVRRVEPYGFTKVSALGIEEQRVNVIVDLTGPSERWRRLGHGYRVEASIVLWEADDVLQLPLSALFRDGDVWAVFVEERGRARLRHVEKGNQNGLAAEIRSGLEPGERVVLYPSDRVSDGVRIEARS
jgi:HlyD family secretion protein